MRIPALTGVVLLLAACGADPDDGTVPWLPTAQADESDSGSAESTGGSSDPTGETDDPSATADPTSASNTTPTTDPSGTSTTDDTSNPGGPAGSCGPDGPTGGIIQTTLASGDYYFVGVPPSDGPLPVVVALHGDEGHPDEAVRWFWTPVYDAEQSFILVMLKCPGCTSWYSGNHDANAVYIWDVLYDVASKYNVDVSRMYAIGYSGGSSMLALHGLEFQEVFAGIQWHCGGGWTSYVQPPRPDCKVDGRFVIATDDFLWDNAKAMEQLLLDNGHEVEFIEAQCSGHCCHTDDLAEGAWAWFQERSKCDAIVRGECADITDVP